MNKKSGYVLLTTIGMLSLMSLLLITLMHLVFILQRTQQQLVQKHQLMQQLVEAAEELSNLASKRWLIQCVHKESCIYIFHHHVLRVNVIDLGIQNKGPGFSMHYWGLRINRKTNPFQSIEIRVGKLIGAQLCTYRGSA